jgi:hypothetical protein
MVGLDIQGSGAAMKEAFLRKSDKLHGEAELIAMTLP